MAIIASLQFAVFILKLDKYIGVVTPKLTQSSYRASCHGCWFGTMP